MNSQRSRDLNELKRQVLNYYAVNADVPKKIEDALNSLFYDSPPDIYGYLSEYFTKFSKSPKITKLVASKSPYYDPKCQQVFRLEVFCQDKNKDKNMVSIYSPCNSPDLIHDSTILQYIQEDDNLRSLKLVEIIKFINTEINEILKNFNPFDQNEIDEKLTKIFQEKQKGFYEKSLLTSSFEHQSVSDMDGKKSKTPSTPKKDIPKATASKAKASTLMANSVVNIQDELQQYFQKNFFGLFALAFLSKAVCLTSIAFFRGQPFERIQHLTSIMCDRYRMPIPMISVLQNGKGFNGKQSLVKEFILMPKPNIRMSEGVDMISKINRNLRDTLYSSKLAPGAMNKCVSDQGCLTQLLDTPQQGIDVVETAINTCFGNFDNASNLNMALNIAAYEIYEIDKVRYEVSTGLFKTSDELIEQYVDIIKKYPRIVMIIDPFHPSDHLAWYKLHARLSEQCLIACTVKNSDHFDQTVANMVTERQSNNSNMEKISDVDETARTEINIIVTKPAAAPTIPINMPVNFYKFENTLTVSSLIEQVKENAAKGNYSGMSCSYNETDDTFISDLCVANQMTFMKVGGFNRSERVNKLNRLIEIENYLADQDLLVNLNEVSSDTEFVNEIEVPDELFETMQTYRQSLNDKFEKSPATKIK